MEKFRELVDRKSSQAVTEYQHSLYHLNRGKEKMRVKIFGRRHFEHFDYEETNNVPNLLE